MHHTDLAWTMDMCPLWRCRWHWRLWICPALRWSRSIELLLLRRRRRRPNMLLPARITTSASAFAHSLLPCSLFLWYVTDLSPTVSVLRCESFAAFPSAWASLAAEAKAWGGVEGREVGTGPTTLNSAVSSPPMLGWLTALPTKNNVYQGSHLRFIATTLSCKDKLEIDLVDVYQGLRATWSIIDSG